MRSSGKRSSHELFKGRAPLIIGLDGHVLGGKAQGTRTTLARLVEAVQRQCGDFRLILYSESNDLGQNSLEHLTLRRLPSTGSLARLLAVIPFLFWRDRVDYGVFQYVTPLWGRNAVFIHDILPITHPHLFSWKMRLKALLLFTLSIRLARVIFVVSDYTRIEVDRVFANVSQKLVTVRNGPSFSPEVYESGRLTPSSRYILTVGRLEKRKNLGLLIDAFNAAALNDVRLIVVGKAEKGFGLGTSAGSRVEIRGEVSEEQLIGLYREASLFVYPSEAEGFGIPLLDATLFGIPSISSDQTAMPEIGRDLVEYFDPTSADAAAGLAIRIRAHFLGRAVPPPSAEQRSAQLELFSWAAAARCFIGALCPKAD